MSLSTVGEFLAYFAGSPPDRRVDVWLSGIGTSIDTGTEMAVEIPLEVAIPDGYVLITQAELDRLKGNEPPPKQPQIIPQIRDFEALVTAMAFAIAEADGFKLEPAVEPGWTEYGRRARAACNAAAQGDQLRCAYPRVTEG
jgi:hypothetical protein